MSLQALQRSLSLWIQRPFGRLAGLLLLIVSSTLPALYRMLHREPGARGLPPGAATARTT